MNKTVIDRLGGYQLHEVVGNSGVGTTYRAEDLSTGRSAAVKVLRSYFASEAQLIDRFKREIGIIMALGHPNILPLYGFGQEENSSFVVEAYVEGGSLRDRLSGPMPVEEAINAIVQISSALDATHAAGLTHRNLKPSNVFIDSEGNVLLADFGMAALGEGVHPLMRTALTTPLPSYMSPEQAQGLPVDARSDVFQLGVLLYELLTCELPFLGYTPLTIYAKQEAYAILRPSDLNPDIPRSVDQIILRAMAQLPGERFASAGALAAALIGGEDATSTAHRPAGVHLPEVAPLMAQTAPEVSTTASPEEVRGEVVLCLICATSTTAGTSVCATCGASLSAAPTVAQSEARDWVRWRGRQRRFGRIVGVALASLGTLFVAAGLTYLALGRPSMPLPAPTSYISSVSGPGEWRMFGVNATHSSYDVGNYPQPKGVVKWRFATKEPIFSSPAVADGKVYLAAGDRRIVALDAATGALIWEHQVTGPVDSSPAVAGDLVYVGLRDHRLLALDAATGKLRWEYATGNPIIASPMVLDGILYVGSGDNKAYTFDALTGKTRWDVKTNGWVKAAPSVVDKLAVVGSQDGKVYILSKKDGRRMYYYNLAGGVSGAPIVEGDTAYVGTDNGRLYSLDIRQKERWGERGMRTAWTQFWIWNIAPKPPPPRGLNWVFTLKGRNGVTSAPVLGNGLLYFGAQDFHLYAVDAATSEERWRFKTAGTVTSSPAIAGNSLYFGSGDGRVYALDALTGSKLWELETGGPVSASPALAGGVLYIASHDGVLYAIE